MIQQTSQTEQYLRFTLSWLMNQRRNAATEDAFNVIDGLVYECQDQRDREKAMR